MTEYPSLPAIAVEAGAEIADAVAEALAIVGKVDAAETARRVAAAVRGAKGAAEAIPGAVRAAAARYKGSGVDRLIHEMRARGWVTDEPPPEHLRGDRKP